MLKELKLIHKICTYDSLEHFDKVLQGCEIHQMKLFYRFLCLLLQGRLDACSQHPEVVSGRFIPENL